MYFYKAYGLTIQSELNLPQLVAIEPVSPDITIRLDKVDRSFIPEGKVNYCYQFNPQEAFFFWAEVATFLVKDGQEIVVEPYFQAEERLIHMPLLGTVLAILLHQRHVLVLHASAVAIDGSVIAFMGDKGQGKSTMSATLYARGHHLLTDDLVALDLSSPAQPLVPPGFPQFKLWPDAAVSIGDDPQTLPELFSGYQKRARRADERFADQSLPIKCICVLASGSEVAFKKLSPSEGIIKLIANSYVNRYGSELIQGAAGARHFKQCASLANSISIYNLERPRALELLPNIAKLLEEHMASLA
ncbi:hypothetical protein [Merismopedia glauca]|uniref:Serine kinase n=1 Tax=Merismopedia glauca CCAP 1448/3 TaxID=1296344 RepID=A0A2T1C276_9CYAN|nr:hypothetical protein [Merismopedia glauca]PSB02278.1 hypothetical protein C7B64_13935 [Merismopedia glauca CCAP 1448/3]